MTCFYDIELAMVFGNLPPLRGTYDLTTLGLVMAHGRKEIWGWANLVLSWMS